MQRLPFQWCFGLLLLSSFASKPVDNLQEGLVAHYTFNDCNARDETGNGSNGQLFGGMGCWCGIEDEGLLFDGVDDYVEFPGKVNAYFRTSDFTISFYFKPEQFSIGRQSLLGKRPDCDENRMFDLLLDVNNLQVKTDVYETPSKNYGNISPTLPGNGWQHFTLVRESFKAQTYINGELQHEGYRCGGLDLENDMVLSFANSPCVGTDGVRRFKGILDELRVYNRALTTVEVRLLYKLHPIENVMMDCVF